MPADPDAEDEERYGDEPSLFDEPAQAAQDRRRSSSLLFAAIYIAAAEADRPRRRDREDRGGRVAVDRASRSASTSLAFGAYVALFRGVDRREPRPPRLARELPDHDGRAGGDAGAVRPAAPAASCSPTGRCARPGCGGPRRPSGWSPSSSSSTRSTSSPVIVFGDPARDRRARRRRTRSSMTIVPAAIAGGRRARRPADRSGARRPRSAGSSLEGNGWASRRR